jgi:hypothetical protein
MKKILAQIDIIKKPVETKVEEAPYLCLDKAIIRREMNSMFQLLYSSMDRRLFDVLTFYRDKGLLDSLLKRQSITVMSLGCGQCDELYPLSQFFAQNGVEIRFVGMDIDDRSVGVARRRFQKISGVSFLVQDFTQMKYEESSTLEGSIDFFILRHPETGAQASAAPSFYKLTNNIIPFFASDDSYLFSSFYFRQELDNLTKNGLKDSYVIQKKIKWNENLSKEDMCNPTEIIKRGLIFYGGQLFVPDQYSLLAKVLRD